LYWFDSTGIKDSEERQRFLLQEESFRSALPHSGADTTKPFDSNTHISNLGTTAAYTNFDYREFLCISITHLQVSV
jgi:hypothetical protein